MPKLRLEDLKPKAVQVRLSKDEHRWLKTLADAADLSVSNYIRQYIKRGKAKMEREGANDAA